MKEVEVPRGTYEYTEEDPKSALGIVRRLLATIAARDATIRRMAEATASVQSWLNGYEDGDAINGMALARIREMLDAALAEQTQPTQRVLSHLDATKGVTVVNGRVTEWADQASPPTVDVLAVIEAQEEADLDEGTRKRGPMTDAEQAAWGAHFDAALAAAHEALGLPPQPTPSPAVAAPAEDGRILRPDSPERLRRELDEVEREFHYTNMRLAELQQQRARLRRRLDIDGT